MAEKIEGFYLNGTEYEIGGAEYNAGAGISIGDISINGRQGPSPDGFHIPSKTEWQGVKTIMDGLSLTTGDSWRINLHMPLAGYRDYDDLYINRQGSFGQYWSSSPLSANSNKASLLFFSSSSVNADANSGRALGASVRCFKDSYETPTSSWTVVQGTLGSAGIFWNQSQGLISITDGTTGYTMMDKNLGATTVYSDGDTLTQANMGNMYQWGNNYGFPSTGSIGKTSSTQVDASGYGPSTANGYYESDTFIAGNGDWSSVHNDDLWGDTTGIITQKNVISNTGVLSVNGQTGDVTIQPGVNYTAGNGIDITDNEIGLDGTYNNYSAMQGPAPSGYHVSLKSEWQAVYGILITTFGLTANATTIGTYLKMPMAGYRHMMNASVQSLNQGSYWTSTPSGSDSACEFVFHSSDIYYNYTTQRAYGFTIRCFKDSPVVPTSSWTTLYDGSSVATGAGVFWNSTDGLISVSGDGQTWYTIMDKNLGATTVYNQGDSATANNCGNFYQWGNNYGFPRPSSMTPDITKSSTKVDASTYGPGNYYNSSTFITVSSSPQDWSSVRNDNLWGGVTGVQAASGKLVVGDKLYKIVTSTTAPASGTASNIITIVTD